MRYTFPILFLLSIALGGSAHAENEKRGWDVSVYGGFSLCTNQPSGDYGTVTSSSDAAFGLGVDYKFSSVAAIGIDLLYVGKSFLRDDAGNLIKYNVAFLEFPVQLKYALGSVVSLHGGIFLPALVIAATKEFSGISEGDKEDFKNDYGLTFGIKFGFKATARLSIAADFRYDLGLTNILNDDEPSHALHSRAFISVLDLSFSL